MTTVTIEKITAHTVIGVEDWERVNPIPVLATVAASYDSTAAESTDNVDAAVDYAVLTQTVADFIGASSFRLLETLAGKTADLILDRFPQTKTVSVSLCKPVILPNTAAVWVTVDRQRKI